MLAGRCACILASTGDPRARVALHLHWIRNAVALDSLEICREIHGSRGFKTKWQALSSQRGFPCDCERGAIRTWISLALSHFSKLVNRLSQNFKSFLYFFEFREMLEISLLSGEEGTLFVRF